ncbi:hypothetical protein LRP88_02033 [Fusarium phalaenopsidis]
MATGMLVTEWQLWTTDWGHELWPGDPFVEWYPPGANPQVPPRNDHGGGSGGHGGGGINNHGGLAGGGTIGGDDDDDDDMGGVNLLDNANVGEIPILHGRVASLRDEIHATILDRNQLRANVANLQQQLCVREDEAREANNRIQTLENDFSRARGGLNDQVADMQTAGRQLETQNVDLRSEIGRLYQQLLAFQNEPLRGEQEANRQEQALRRELNDERQRAMILEQFHQEATRQQNERQGQLKRARQEATRRQGELEQLRQARQEAIQRRDEIEG